MSETTAMTNNESFLARIERIPVPLLPAMVGMITLSNIYNGLGFPLVRHITVWVSAIIVLFYIIKMFRYPKTCLNEYNKNVIFQSLYPGFPMLFMGIGAYIAAYNFPLGKALLFTGVCIDAVHIVLFFTRNVFIKRNVDTFVPSWFVTSNGIMVSTVVGEKMGEPFILSIIVYYGIAIYAILIPVMVFRLLKYKLAKNLTHTLAITLAPVSLCVYSYINIIPEPNLVLLGVLYVCEIITTIFVFSRLPLFFSYPFIPAFAGLTFPNAIGAAASMKLSAFLASSYPLLSGIIKQIAGLQILVTSTVIGYVMLQFFMCLIRTPKRSFS